MTRTASTSMSAAGGAGKPRYGQLPIACDADRQAAVPRAHALFRWAALGWKVNPRAPGPPAFAAAGFTHLSINQIGGDRQEPFLEWTQKTLMPAWREAFGS